MSDTASGDREGVRRWLENWQRVGPILDAEKWDRLRSMSQAEAQRVTADLLALWQPDWRGDDGEELLLHQRVFARLRRTR